MTQSLLFPLHRLRGARLLMVPINSIRQDKPFLGCFTKAAGVAEANSQRALEMAQPIPGHRLASPVREQRGDEAKRAGRCSRTRLGQRIGQIDAEPRQLQRFAPVITFAASAA
jgi:hypothetical protein